MNDKEYTYVIILLKYYLLTYLANVEDILIEVSK